MAAVRNANNKVKPGPTDWSYEMLKAALASDPSTDVTAFKDNIVKLCIGGKRPVVAGDALQAVVKAMSIEYRVPKKESSGRLQYGLNTPDNVNMV